MRALCARIVRENFALDHAPDHRPLAAGLEHLVCSLCWWLPSPLICKYSEKLFECTLCLIALNRRIKGATSARLVRIDVAPMSPPPSALNRQIIKLPIL
jgi:hypothetical protein